MNSAKRTMTDFLSFIFCNAEGLYFKECIFLKSTWGNFFCCPAASFQQTCRMKEGLLHPPGIISIVLQKINPTNSRNPNILKKMSTLEWMKWASVEGDNHLWLEVEDGLHLATAVLLCLVLYPEQWPTSPMFGDVVSQPQLEFTVVAVSLLQMFMARWQQRWQCDLCLL